MDFVLKIQKELNDNKEMDNCCYKLDDDNGLVMFYDNTFDNTLTTYKYKNIIYDINTEQPIASQYNQPITNTDNITTYIKNNNITNDITIRFCYEGTHIIVFNHNNKWFISTRKCLDARESKWNNKSHYDMFMETIKGKFNLNDLDKNYCYHFNLIHNQNYRSIKYSTDTNFMFLDLLFITEKQTLKQIEINDSTFLALDFVVENETQKFSGNKEEVIKLVNDQYIKTINSIDSNKQKEVIMKCEISENEKKLRLDNLHKEDLSVYLSFEGFAINMIDDKNRIVICKVQNPLYSYSYAHPVSKFNLNFPKYDILYSKFIIDKCKELNIKPLINKQIFIKNVNDTRGKFEVIQYDLSQEEEELNKLISYFDKDLVNNAMINIKNNINNLSYLIRDVYFQFLKPNDSYNKLPDSYKTIKYLIHGLYLNKMEINKSLCNGEKFSVNQELIYNYLLTYNPDSVKELIIDYPEAVKVMHGVYKGDKGFRKYHLIKLPQHIMKFNKKDLKKKH